MLTQLIYLFVPVAIKAVGYIALCWMCNSARRAAWAPKFMDLMQQGVRPLLASEIYTSEGRRRHLRPHNILHWGNVSTHSYSNLLHLDGRNWSAPFKLFSAQSFFDSNVIQHRYSASGCPFKEHISASHLPKSINLERKRIIHLDRTVPSTE